MELELAGASTPPASRYPNNAIGFARARAKTLAPVRCKPIDSMKKLGASRQTCRLVQVDQVACLSNFFPKAQDAHGGTRRLGLLAGDS